MNDYTPIHEYMILKNNDELFIDSSMWNEIKGTKKLKTTG